MSKLLWVESGVICVYRVWFEDEYFVLCTGSSGWEVSNGEKFIIYAPKETYGVPHAKVWAEEEILKYLQKKLSKLENAIVVLTSST